MKTAVRPLLIIVFFLAAALPAAALICVWNGSASNAWNTAANWDGGNIPSVSDIVSIPDSSVVANSPLITSHVSLSLIVIESMLTINSGSSLIIVEDSGMPGAFSISSLGDFVNNGTLIFENNCRLADSRTAPGRNLGNVIMRSSGIVDVQTDIKVKTLSLLNNIVVEAYHTITVTGVDSDAIAPADTAFHITTNATFHTDGAHSIIFQSTGASFTALGAVKTTGTNRGLSISGAQSITATNAVNNVINTDGANLINLSAAEDITFAFNPATGDCKLGAITSTAGAIHLSTYLNKTVTVKGAITAQGTNKTARFTGGRIKWESGGAINAHEVYFDVDGAAPAGSYQRIVVNANASENVNNYFYIYTGVLGCITADNTVYVGRAGESGTVTTLPITIAAADISAKAYDLDVKTGNTGASPTSALEIDADVTFPGDKTLFLTAAGEIEIAAGKKLSGGTAYVETTGAHPLTLNGPNAVSQAVLKTAGGDIAFTTAANVKIAAQSSGPASGGNITINGGSRTVTVGGITAGTRAAVYGVKSHPDNYASNSGAIVINAATIILNADVNADQRAGGAPDNHVTLTGAVKIGVQEEPSCNGIAIRANSAQSPRNGVVTINGTIDSAGGGTGAGDIQTIQGEKCIITGAIGLAAPLTGIHIVAGSSDLDAIKLSGGHVEAAGGTYHLGNPVQIDRDTVFKNTVSNVGIKRLTRTAGAVSSNVTFHAAGDWIEIYQDGGGIGEPNIRISSVTVTAGKLGLINNPVYISGALTASTSGVEFKDDSAIYLGGNLTLPAISYDVYDISTIKIVFDGAGNQVITPPNPPSSSPANSQNRFPNIEIGDGINTPSVSLVSGGILKTYQGDLTVKSGTLTLSGGDASNRHEVYNVTLGAAIGLPATLALSANAYLAVGSEQAGGGNWVRNATGVLNANAASTVYLSIANVGNVNLSANSSLSSSPFGKLTTNIWNGESCTITNDIGALGDITCSDSGALKLDTDITIRTAGKFDRGSEGFFESNDPAYTLTIEAAGGIEADQGAYAVSTVEHLVLTVPSGSSAGKNIKWKTCGDNLDNSASMTLDVQAVNNSSGGTIEIDTGTGSAASTGALNLQTSGAISASGAVTLKARDTLTFGNYPVSAAAGNVEITAKTLDVTGGGPGAITAGGAGGTVTVQPRETISDIHINHTGTGMTIPLAVMSAVSAAQFVVGRADGAGAIYAGSEAGATTCGAYDLTLRMPAHPSEANAIVFDQTTNYALTLAAGKTLTLDGGNFGNIQEGSGTLNIIADTLKVTAKKAGQTSKLKTQINKIGASSAENIAIMNNAALHFSGAVDASAELFVQAQGNITQAAAISGNKGYFEILEDPQRSSITLDTAVNSLSEVSLKRTTNSASSLPPLTHKFKNGNASGLTCAAFVEQSGVVIEETTGTLTVSTVNSLQGVKTNIIGSNDATGDIVLTAAAGIELVKNIENLAADGTCGAVRLESPVTLIDSVEIKTSGDAGGGAIRFSSTVNSDDGGQILTVNAMDGGKITFLGAAGGGTNPLSSLDVTSLSADYDAISLSANVTTSGLQEWHGNVTLKGDVTLESQVTAGGSAIVLYACNGDTAGARSLSLQTAGGALGFQGDVGGQYAIKNLTIGGAPLAAGTSANIKLTGTLTTDGTAAAPFDWKNAVIEFTGTGAAQITGAQSFYDLKCQMPNSAQRKTIMFPPLADSANPVSQIIRHDIILDYAALITSGTQNGDLINWFQLDTTNANTLSITNCRISYGESVIDLRAIVGAAGSGNSEATASTTVRFFPRSSYVWTGVEGTDWDNAKNWLGNDAPPDLDTTNISIPAVTAPNSYPVLNVDITAGTITVASGASFDVNNKNIAAGTVANSGTFKIQGNSGGTITTKTNNANSTVMYYGAAAVIIHSGSLWGETYKNLAIQMGAGGSLQASGVLNADVIDCTDNYGALTFQKIFLRGTGASVFSRASGSPNSITFGDSAGSAASGPPYFIYSTNGGSISFTCPIEIKNVFEIKSIDGNSTSATTFQFAGISADAVCTGVTVDAGAGKVVFTDTVNAPLASLAVSGAAGITTDDSSPDLTMSVSSLTAESPVTLKRNVAVTAASGSIAFNAAVNSDGTARDLTLISPSVNFNGAAGGTSALNTLKIENGVIGISKPNAFPLSITANTLEFTGASATGFNTTTPPSANRGITLVLDALTVPASGFSIAAGTEDTSVLAIQKKSTGDTGVHSAFTDRLNIPAIVFTNAQAKEMIIGSTSYMGGIYICDDGNVSYSGIETVRIRTDSSISFGNNTFQSTFAGGGTIELQGNAITKSSGVDIKTGTLLLQVTNDAGSSANPLLTEIANVGASSIGDSLYLKNTGALNFSGSVSTGSNAADVMSVEAESLTQSAGAILTGNTGLFSLETGTTSGIALDNANGFSNVCLTQSGGTSISAVYRNNGSYTVAANFPGSVTARAAAAGAVITVGTVNSVDGISTFYAGVPVLLSAPAGIKLVKNISAGGDITFESPVVMGVDTLVSVSSTYLGSAITFESTLNGYMDSGVNKGNLALSAASGSVIFNAPVGGAVRLNTLAIKQGSVSNGASSPALSITADTINLGESAAVDFDTSASANKNITFKTDKVDIQTTGPVSINAGTGSFQISPSTVTKTIEYGDAESLSKDVYYSSDWSAITAAAFIVGGASQTGAVFISEVANTPVTVTFKTAASARVFFEGDYSVADTLPNTVYFETGGITINGGHTIDLKDNAWHAPPPVTLAGTASPSTAVIKAGGGITFDSTVMPDGSANTRNLTLDAASGNVTLGGAAGSSSNKIGDLIIEHNPSGAGAAALVLPAVYSKGAVTAHHNGIVTLNGSITAAGDVSEKGSGGVSFGGSYTITGDSVLLTNNISASGKDIGFTAANSTNKKVNLGGDITISARQIDFNGNINGDSDNDSTANYSLSIDHTGLLNLESVFVSQLTEYGSGGSVRIGGYGIAASALLETENGLSFDNNIVLYQDSDFNSKGGGVTVNSVFSRPSSSFSAVLTADGAVTLNGSIGSTAARMSYIKIEANGLTTQNSVLYSNATSAPPGTGISLNILNITGDLSLDARGAGGAVNIAIEQNILHNGSLAVLAGDFNLDAHNYYMSDTPLGDSGFSGNGSRVLTLGPQTKFIINGVDFKTDSSFAINASPVSTLVINGSCSILLGDRSKQALGGVTIESASTLTAQSDLTVQGDWTQTGGFTHGDKLVEFAGSDVTITGSTSWYKFLCAVPGATIKFSNSGDTHTFENEVRIEGTKERPIVLNAVTVNPSPSPPFPSPTTDFWVIDVSMAASYLFKYVKVYHSYAYPMGINASPNEVWTGTSAPYWTINWKTEFYYIFGFTEDTDGDGRIDRIRVQATETIGGDFGDFRMDVEGYTVTGYDSVGSTFPSPFIYLNVQPQVRHDGNARPALRLVNPGGLIGEVSGRSLGVIQGFTLRAADTTPPRLLYSLTHPDSGQLYMKFSEPVTGTPSLSSPIGSKIFTFAGKADADGLLFSTGDGPFTADDIIADDNAVRYQENIILDVTDTGAGWPADPYALGFTSSSYNPSYPTAADYSGYAPVDISSSWPGALDNDVFSASGMNFQPHPSGPFEWSSGRRVSDILLLAQPPAASSAGSLWPNYAKGANGESLIQQWDGSKTLVLTRNWENKDYSIDMNITAKNNLANADTAPDLIFGFNIPNIYREGKASGNLWLPSIRAEGSFDFAQNFVPQTYAGTDRAGDGTSDVQYHIAENSLKDMNTFDFIFEVPLTASVDSSIPLFAARLDLKNSRWWKLKPFSFIVRDIVRQSGGVSIVNNVLNPLKGGKTKLIYVLTKPGQVTVNVFSLDGVLIRNLYRGHRETGEHFAEWDGRNNGGNAVARGVYFIRIVGPDIDEIRKIMLVK